MSFSEQADFSAERTDQPNLLDRLRAEQLKVGSPLAYVHSLVEGYAFGDHRANMLQLWRMAGMITNPNMERTFSHSLTEAFYRGEVLGYRSQEEMDPTYWSEESYAMFSTSMEATLREQRQLDVSFQHNKLIIGERIIGELEEMDDRYIHPGLDNLIIEWSEQMATKEVEQWYTILGFRHVVSQVVKRSMGEDPGFLEKEFQFTNTAAKFGTKFLAITEQQEFDDIDEVGVESIDDVRNSVIDSLADHTLAAASFGIDGTEELETFLNTNVRTDFEAMEGLKDGEIVRMEGNGVFVMYNHESESENIYLLAEGESLQGIARNVSVAPVPTSTAIKAMRRQQVDTQMATSHEDTDLLGVVLVVEDPVIILANGEPIRIGDEKVAGIVLNNSDMHLIRYLV